MYNTIVIDPRPKSQDAMSALLEQNAPIVGIEFTLPALSRYIAGNIDGQHSADAEGRAACEIAMACDLPSQDTTLAIVRPDNDALLAAAILSFRAQEGIHPQDFTSEMIARIQMIAQQDKFEHGAWPGPRPLSMDYSSLEFNALGIIAMNHGIPIMQRVRLFEQWLVNGTCDGFAEACDSAKRAFESAVNDSNVSVDGSIAIVESHHSGAPGVGYHFAPVVVIRNDAFRFTGVDGTHVKYTICQFCDLYVDMPSIISELNKIEQSGGTWGGSRTICGSPQGVSSSLSLEQIVEVVKAHQ
jgi:hypothetical protein